MILVDRRTGSAELIPYFARGEARLDTMPAGDFAFWGRGHDYEEQFIGIERKSLRDLVGSIRTKRLQGLQLPKMQRCFDLSVLIVEGEWKPRQDGALMVRGWDRKSKRYQWMPLVLGRSMFRYSEFSRWLIRAQIAADVVVLRSLDKRETVQLVLDLHACYQNPRKWIQRLEALPKQRDHGAGLEGKPARLRRPGLLQRVAACYKDIGWERSDAVAHEFSTVLEFISADPATLRARLQHAKVGDTISRRVYQHSREKGVP